MTLTPPDRTSPPAAWATADVAAAGAAVGMAGRIAKGEEERAARMFAAGSAASA